MVELYPSGLQRLVIERQNALLSGTLLIVVMFILIIIFIIICRVLDACVEGELGVISYLQVVVAGCCFVRVQLLGVDIHLCLKLVVHLPLGYRSADLVSGLRVACLRQVHVLCGHHHMNQLGSRLGQHLIKLNESIEFDVGFLGGVRSFNQSFLGIRRQSREHHARVLL